MDLTRQSVPPPFAAKIMTRTEESPDIFTFGLKFTDPDVHAAYQFAPGQFNMLYLFGVGEVPISIISDPEDDHLYAHTIRQVGRVTAGLALLQPGAEIGVRGPFGQGWPMAAARGKDVLIVTGGLGCAPSVSIIHYILKRRQEFGHLTILQGVKHSDDLIFRQQYDQWAQLPDTDILLAADVATPSWIGHTGQVTELLDTLHLNRTNTISMMCGPEGMMIAAARHLLTLGLPIESIFLSLERNMECAVGHCGHCQFGGEFICKDGPVFPYATVQTLLGKKGF